MPQKRKLVVPPAIQDAINHAITDYPRLHQAWEGWQWRLERDPLTDSQIVPMLADLRIIKSDPQLNEFGFPTLTVIYKVTDTEVHVERMKIGSIDVDKHGND